mmetsp:Transcript_2223/g.3491  ORF Transcript_2223/g.3491 Transcript_2223/m.3491 type:complete len:290 (-) Transcript_2223:1251-2120(-)
MMRWLRIDTSSVSARFLVSRSAMPTLPKQKMAASLSLAILTSDVVTTPVLISTGSMIISSLESVPMLTNASRTASNAPCESALITTGILIVPASSSSSPSKPYFSCALCNIKPCFAAVPVTWSSTSLSKSALSSLLNSDSLRRMISFASSSEDAHTIGSPAFGNDLNPTMRTGCDGLPFFRGLFATSFRNLTRPPVVPDTTKSPLSTLPHLMTQSATTPNPFSIRASMTIPSPFASSSARRSIISLCNAKPSIKSSRPSPVIPETGNNWHAPNSPSSPIFSVKISCSIN